MARTFKEPPKQNLLRIPVLVEDVRSYSDYFEVSDLNTIFHAGKNGFLLRGSQFLKRNTQVFVEVLDRFDRPVFATAVPNFSEGGARLISVEVFQRTERGPGKLVIVGTANRFADLTSIPEEQTQSPNVRWVVPIVIEPRNENTTKIRLANSPTVTAEEKNFRTTRIDRVTTSDSTYSASVVYDYEVHKSDGYAIQMVDSSGTPVNFFDDVNIDGYFTGSIVKVEANRWYADDVEAPSSRSVVSVKDSDDDGYVTASVYLPLTKTLDQSTAISNTPIKFGNKTDYLNPVLRSGSYERILKTANLGGGVEKRLVEEITSSVVFQYVSESTVQVSATSSVVNFRIPFVSTHTGEIKKIKIGAKEANDNITSFQPFAEFVPSEKNILVTSSAIGDLAVGRFLENSTLQNNWYGGLLNNSSGTFNQSEYESSGSVTYPRTIFTSSAKILEGAYVDHTSGSGTPYYFGTKNFYQLYPDVEYTLKYSAVYSPSYTSGSDTYTTPITGSLKTYLTRIGNGSVARGSSSVVVTDVNPYGQLIDTVNTLTSDKSRYEKEVNFTVQKAGVAYLRFIVDSGFWNFSDIQITPAIEKGFNPDEIIFDAENNFLKDSTNQFKVQFLNFNDEPIQYEVITDPIFLSGSRAVKSFKLIPDRTQFTFSGSLASPTAQTASITSELINIIATPTFTVVDDSGSAVKSSLFKLDGNDIEIYPFAATTSSVLVTGNVDGFQDKVRIVKIVTTGTAVPGEPGEDAPKINLILDGPVSFVSSSAGVQPAATTSKITGSWVRGGTTYLVSGSISGSIESGFETFTAGGGSGKISSSWNRAGTDDLAYEFRFFSQSDASAGTFTQVGSQAYVMNLRTKGDAAPRINLILDGPVTFVSSSTGVQPAATTSKITGSLVEDGTTYLVSGSISGSIESGFQTFTAGSGSTKISGSWNRAGTKDVAYEFRFFSQSDASAGTFTQVGSQAYVINLQGNELTGSSGTDARAVSLTMVDQTFEYNTAGTTPSPTGSIVTATALNTTGTVYYEFLVTGSSQQNSTTSTYPYLAPASSSALPEILEVKIREGADDSDVKARDQISALGLRKGTDAITIEMTNEAHTLPTTAQGVVTYDGSGTDIRVYAGTTPLSVSGTGAGTFSVTTSTENITAGSATTVSTYTRRFADASSCTADTAKITYTITVRDLANTTSTFTKVQSFSKSHQGDPGTPATAFSIKYDDLQTTGATDSAGEYSLLTGSAKNPPSDATGTNTDAKLKNDVTSILLAWKDADSVVRTSVLDNIEIGDTIQYWVSGQRWYSYRVTGISGSAGTAINLKRNRQFAVNFISSDTTDGTGDLPTADGNDVYFRFSRAAPAKPALPPIVYVAQPNAYDSSNVGTPTSPTLANLQWTTWDTASALYPNPEGGTFPQTSSLFSNINYIGLDANVSSSKTSYGGIPTAASYVKSHAQSGSFVTIYYNEDNFGVYTYETLEADSSDVVIGVSHSVSIGTLDGSTPEINFSSPVTSSDGSAGTDARAVNLTADDLTFEYNTAGSSPSPTTATITATALNTTGTVYYEFLVTGSSHQNSTTSTFTYPAPPDISSMPNIIEVKIREGADDSDVKARDQISALGLREGTDAITIEMTNEAHTLPTTAEGVVTYDDSGTDIRVYAGTTPLSASVSATASGVFSVAASGEDITVGSVSTSGSYTRRFADASSCTADTAKITYTITVRDLADTTSTFTKVQSFSKSHQGDPGTPATAFSIKYDDLQTTGATDSAGEYSLLTGSAKNPPSDATGTNTDAKLKSDVTSILLAWKDADSVVRTSVLDNIEIGDTIQYWVSGQRWYSYRVTGISGSAGTAINQKRNRRFAVNPIGSDTTDGTGNLPTADGNDVYFRFSRAAPAKPALPPIVYVADTFTSYDNSAGTPTSPTLANSHWATWDTASANYPSADGTFTQTSSLFSNINYIGIGADVSSTKTSYNRVPTAANYVRIHAQTGSFVTIYYNEDNFGVYTYETLEYSTNDVVLGVSHSVSIGTLDSSTPEINFSSPVTSSDGARGAAGPGILFKGDWDALPSSSIVGQTATSRDVVSVGEPAVYYYFESGSADGSETLDPPQSASKAYIDSESAHPTGSAAARYWKAFESFKAVATDMLLAQDIYTHRTVNVGMTSSQGGVNDAAAITLSSDFANSGSNPFISIGQGVYKNYGNAGVFIGSGSGNPKLSLVGSGSSPQYLKWDGAQLDISGSISASSGAINGPLGISGTNAKLYVGSGSYSHSGTPFYVDKDGQFSLRDKFVFDPSDSSLAIAGTISASAGAINGPLGISETGAKIYVGAGTYNNSNTAFYVDNNGSFSLGDKLTFDTSANLSIDGTITSTAGSIGGWEIHSTRISKNTGTAASAIISSSGDIVLGTGTSTLHLSGKDSNYRIWAGAAEYDSANFLLSAGGALTATSASIAGNITATTGTIGGWDVGATLSKTNILLDPSTPKITLGSKSTLTDSNTGVYIGTDGIALGANSVFKVTSAGAVSATNVDITGDISASAGAISGILSVGNLIIGQGADTEFDAKNSPSASPVFTAVTSQSVTLSYSDDAQLEDVNFVGTQSTTTDAAVNRGNNVSVAVNIYNISNISNGGSENPTAFSLGGTWKLNVYQNTANNNATELRETHDIGSTFTTGQGPAATFEYGSIANTKIKFEIEHDLIYSYPNDFSSQHAYRYNLSATTVTPIYSVDEGGFFIDVGNGRVNFASAAVSSAGGGVVGSTGTGVQITGTPSDNQVAVWTGIRNIEGTAGLTYDGSTLDVTGTIDASVKFLAGDGSNSAPAFSFSSDSNTGMYRPAANEIGFATDGGHKVRIDTAGNVGIGTTSPAGLLHLAQSNSDGLYFTRSGYDTFELSLASDGMRLYNITDTRTDFFVDGDGNVGIGTNSPDNTLHVKNATDISMGSSATGQFRIQGSGYNAAIALDGSNMNIYHNSSARGLVLGTNETARLTITAGGNVGIGTTSPHDKLHVVGNVFIEDGSPEITLETTSASHRNWQIAAQENVSQALEISVGSQDSDASNDTFTPVIIALYNSTANRVGINDTGPSYELDVTGTINATVEIQVESDIRLKNELPFTVQGLEAVDKLRPIKYTLKSDEDETPKVRLGFSAQEVLEIIPEVVSTDDEGYHAVAYQKLVPVLVKAIQELTEEVRELKKNVEG